jgi:hypothetical protein
VATPLLPLPALPITVRAATLADVPFIDALQKKQSKAVGFMPTKSLEGKIEKGEVLVASGQLPVAREGGAAPLLNTDHRPLTASPIGYLIGSDRYFKHDDVGIIYQVNVAPGRQRGFVGASLVKAVFERAAYGCRLFCCWCAQDLEANYFWESMGFIPLAIRAGAKGTRTHIFWQRRMRQDDVMTPYWCPSKTDGGHMREDRIVLPIPPGVHWKDEMPVLLPTAGVAEVQKALPGEGDTGVAPTCES